jgi:hypothetical protein
MSDDTASRRDLIARIATLELLVSDLIALLWRADPAAMETLASEAARDLEIQHTRTALPAAEHQRDRLFGVLQERRRKLQHRRAQTG